MALLQEDHELLEEATDPVGLDGLALDGDLVAPHVDLDAGESAFDEPQQLVALAEQARHQVIPGHADLHLGRAHDLAKRTVGRWTSPAVRCRRALVCWADRISPPDSNAGWPMPAAPTPPPHEGASGGCGCKPTNRRPSPAC